MILGALYQFPLLLHRMDRTDYVLVQLSQFHWGHFRKHVFMDNLGVRKDFLCDFFYRFTYGLEITIHS
jgi:hypothetical protein